jgi:hypothetical protein
MFNDLYLTLFRAVSDYLLSTENMAHVGKNLGAYDLIKSQVFFLK